MEIKYFELAEKNPARLGRGRRYYVLRATRVLHVPVQVTHEAYPIAYAQALSNEVAVSVGNCLPVPLPAYAENQHVLDTLRRIGNGRQDFIIDEILPTLWLTLPDGQRVAATSCHWLALPNGAVCEYAGQMYQVCASNALMPVNL